MVQRIVGIDLGSYSVKTLTLEPRGKGGFEVLAYGESVLAPSSDADGAPSLRDRQSDALGDLKARGLLDGDVFVTGLPGEAAVVRTMTFPFSDRAKIAEALPFTLESEISLDLDDIVWSWFVTDDGRASRKGETQVMCAFARREAVQDVLDLLAVHGIDPRYVEFDALALDDLWEGLFVATHGDLERRNDLQTPGGTVIEVSEGAPKPAVALVDIGHRRTSVCILSEGRVVAAHAILHGGADATRALAREIGIPLDEAERGKRKEAFIEVVGAVAQFAEQQQISDALKRAYAPVVKRLRQAFQSTISSNRLRVVKVVLTGGGSRVLNLDRHLAEELNVRVMRGRELAAQLKGKLEIDDENIGAPETALSFAYALSALAGARARDRLDFRVGPFAWKGDFDFVRERAPALSAWAAALLLLLGVGAGVRGYVLSHEETRLVQRELAVCKEITGQDIDSFSRCLAMIQERIGGTSSFQVPEIAAADVFLEISRRMPPASEMPRKVTELDVTGDRVRLKGTTGTYENIDAIVQRLQGGRCFSLVEKGKARNVSADSVEFNVTITLDCAAAPGDGGAGIPTTTTPAPRRPSLPMIAPAMAPPAAPAAAASPPIAAPQPVVFDGDATSAGPSSPASPADLEQRRERLRKLREDRLQRRTGFVEGGAPVARPNLRDRFNKTIPALDNRGGDGGGG